MTNQNQPPPPLLLLPLLLLLLPPPPPPLLKVEDDGSHLFTDYVGLRGDYVDGHIPGAVFVDWVKVR